jgi:hypothetical protein
MLICLTAAVIEALQMIVVSKDYYEGKPDPDAITWTAHKDHKPAFNYIPGRSTYDDKHKRYVTDWRYEWEYKGRTHTIMVCDNPNSQYEHYMATFPETVTLTIHKDTGKYYVPKNERARKRKYLLSLAISFLAGVCIVNMFM